MRKERERGEGKKGGGRLKAVEAVKSRGRGKEQGGGEEQGRGGERWKEGGGQQG